MMKRFIWSLVMLFRQFLWSMVVLAGRSLWSLAVLLSLFFAVAYGNYLATVPGSGTTFGSIVVSAVHYAQMLICDPTTPANCASIGTYGTNPGAVRTMNVTASIAQDLNSNGQKVMAMSAPVVIASDQSNIPVNTAPTGASGNALTGVTCGSAVSSCVLKNAAGNFYGVYAECTSACWLMVFNSVSAPTNGATTAGIASGNLVECVDIAANSARSISYPMLPTNYSVGITAAISSTACATLTLSTVGFIRGTVL